MFHGISRSGPDACPQALDLPGRWNQGYAFTASCKVDYLMRARMSDQLAGVALVERQRSADAPDHAPMRRSYAADQGEV